MNAVTHPFERISVDDYLLGEQQTDIKHEYLDGQVVAMGGASDRHGLLTVSLASLLLPHARRKGCQLFVADMKLRLDHDGASYFYYPDLLLSCDPADRESPLYRRTPACSSKCCRPPPNASTRAKNCSPTACCPACANTCCCARTPCTPSCTSAAAMAAGRTSG
nr:Uma2 family endonuclease [Ottowia beijingensis]